MGAVNEAIEEMGDGALVGEGEEGNTERKGGRRDKEH